MAKAKFKNGDDESLNVKQLLQRFVAMWPVFLIMLVVTLSCALVYLHYTLRVYESKATIQIKDEKKGIEDSRMVASFDLFSTKKIVENEIELLRSRTVMKEVVKKLNLYAPIMIDGRINDLSAYLISPVNIQLKDPDHLKEGEKVSFEFNEHTKEVVVNSKNYPLNVWLNSEWGIIRFVPNVHYDSSKNGKGFYFSLVDVRKVADGLINNLDVSPTSKLSTVVSLTLKDQVPERSEHILNAVIEEYNQAAVQYKNTLATNAIAFVEQRLRYVVDDLDSVELAIQHFRTEKGVVDISEQGKLFLSSVENNDQKISEINVQLAVLEQVEKSLQSTEVDPGIAPSTLGLSDGLLSGLLTKLNDTEMEYERLKRTTAENNPILLSLKNQIEKIKPSIIENVHSQRNNLLASRVNLTQTSDRYSSMLKGIPQKERQLLDITRQQSIKNNIYTFLLQKREEAALSFTAAVADSRLIDNAQSGWDPVSPNSTKIMALAFILGLGIPAGFIVFKDLLNETIRSNLDIQALCSFPFLGEINYERSKNAFVQIDMESSYVAEQIQQIRTSLPYLGVGAQANKILITSTVSGEGKTFVAINIATSLALSDKKVVLVELDLRKPGLAKLFKLKIANGMSHFLKKKSGIDQVIYPTTINNLHLIPAGEIPTHPSQLISNGKLDELLKHLSETFDYVIIETAPIRPVSDAYLVSKLCDATLFIVRQNKTLKDDLRQLEATYKIRGFHNLAIILNGVRPMGFGRQEYKYHYGVKK